MLFDVTKNCAQFIIGLRKFKETKTNERKSNNHEFKSKEGNFFKQNY